MKKLSIIIPMYNVEPYVERCIRSLEDQDVPKDSYEVICVNDGSPDDSRGIIIQLKKEFSNLILIDQENKGVSCARNEGIDRAIGQYILFIDPDDYVHSNCLKRIIELADIWHAQVTFLGFKMLREDGSVLKEIRFDIKMNNIYNGNEAYYISRGNGVFDPDRMVAVLFDREFININSLRYLPGVPYLEDGEFIARILCLAERCIFDGGQFYLRTSRAGSATHSDLFHSANATSGFLKAAQNLKAFSESALLTIKQKEFLHQPICKFVVLFIDSVSKQPLNFNSIFLAKRILHNTGLGRLNLKQVTPEFRLLGTFYNHFTILLPSYMWLVNRFRYIRKRITGDFYIS